MAETVAPLRSGGLDLITLELRTTQSPTSVPLLCEMPCLRFRHEGGQDLAPEHEQRDRADTGL